MNTPQLDPEIFAELKSLIEKGLASGDLMTAEQISLQTKLFQQNFGPSALRSVDGEALLTLMHGREKKEFRCLAYWLEFKNDDEFSGYRFGGIGGGSALKYGLFQRQTDGAWVTGTPGGQRVISIEQAIAEARRQRDELLRGADVLAAFDGPDNDLSDSAYARLQLNMERAAPHLSNVAWAHKYWFLLFSNLLDDYHSPRYQRFHLFKLLQTPPDGVGILDSRASRFVCAGRFIAAARALGAHVSTLNRALNQRDHAFHRYWCVGTTEGENGDSQWSAMRAGSYVSLGWPDQLPDLTATIGLETAAARDQIRKYLLPFYASNPATATRKAGEVLNLAREMSEDDLVLACDGQAVHGIGRIVGAYQYEQGLSFPHKRPVEWLSLDPWRTPEQEGLRTTVFEIGRSAKNLLEIERQLFRSRTRSKPAQRSRASTVLDAAPLPALDPVTARIEGILRRKGQVILYGPPGTGKTYYALTAARELASRRAFGKSFSALSEQERNSIKGPNGFVRVCTFHPGYAYEDFVEGLRPRTAASGQMVFEPRAGLFKQLCLDAQRSDRHYFLVIDEINRGDLARILGELITVLEQDKRGTSVILPVTQTPFAVPKNVFIVGTMNTADRSTSLMDTALRRRFGFVELMPSSAQLAGQRAGELPLGPWLDALNARLRRHLKRDARNLQIGHAYLMPAQPITSVTDFVRVLRDDIIPMLEEYCYDDFQLLKDILGADLVDVDASRIREGIFTSNREHELIQAISFEEMESLALSEESAEPLTEDDAEDPQP